MLSKWHIYLVNIIFIYLSVKADNIYRNFYGFMILNDNVRYFAFKSTLIYLKLRSAASG